MTVRTCELTPRRWPELADDLQLQQLFARLQGTRDSMDDTYRSLAEYGDPQMADLVREAAATGRWEDVVAHFGSALGAPGLVYAGPMRVSEAGPTRPGLIIGRRDPIGTAISGTVAAQADLIGNRIFGYPADLRNRIVEFYDLHYAAGPVAEASVAPIALFTPYYLGGWQDTERQQLLRRSIMFSNVVAGRFRLVAAQAARNNVLIDGREPAVLRASDDSLRRAVACWLSLHEMMHGSGPAPFFAAWTGKSALGDTYGMMEEFRVDATSFMAAGLMDPAPHAILVQEIILLERLFRSGRRGLRMRAAGNQLKADEAHGLLWVGALTDRAMNVTRHGLCIDMAAVADLVTRSLARIYAVEQAAAESSESQKTLAAAAARLRSSLEPANLIEHPAARALLDVAHLPDAVRLPSRGVPS
jgi:Family of unknown function (DUF6421)